MIKSSYYRTVATVLPIMLIAPSVLYALNHCTIFPWDQAAYGRASIELWITLTRHPQLWLNAMFDVILKSRPPLLVWFGQLFVPVGQLLYSVDHGLLLEILVLQCCTLSLMLSIGKQLDKERRLLSGICSCLITASAPLFIGISSEYWVEPIQLFSIAMIWWVAVRSKELDCLQTGWWLLLSCSLMVLTKASSPLYCFAPAAYAGWNAGQSYWNKKGAGNISPHKNLPLAIAAIVAAVAAVLWYLRNINNTWITVEKASFSIDALNYGQKLPFISKLLLWINVLETSFFLPGFEWCFALLLVIVIAVASVNAAKTFRNQHRQYVEIGVVALVQILGALAVLSSNIGQDSRYALAILPSWAILLTVLICALRNNLVKIVFAAF